VSRCAWLLCVGFALVASSAFGIQPKNAEATLGELKRVYIDVLAGGAPADQMRDMIINALQQSGLFAVTENAERADAILKGSADDQTFSQEHITSDSIGFRAGDAGGTRNSVGLGTSSSSTRRMSAGISDSESSHVQERRHEAVASVRLVNGVGDVIWSTTQESAGAKFRGAMSDVADKVARRLIEETNKAREQVAVRAIEAHAVPGSNE